MARRTIHLTDEMDAALLARAEAECRSVSWVVARACSAWLGAGIPVGDLRRGPRWRVEDRGFGSPCWVWQDVEGPYASTLREGRSVPAHRAMYEDTFGPVPEGHHVHHRCEVTLCVNPAHLEPLTPAEHARVHAGVV